MMIKIQPIHTLILLIAVINVTLCGRNIHRRDETKLVREYKFRVNGEVIIYHFKLKYIELLGLL